MIASLPMYDRPETAEANDRLWVLIRKSLRQEEFDCPETLSRDVEGVEHWLDPELIFSQTCGMPYRLHLHGKVHLIGTPVTTVDGPGGYYHSVMVCHKNKPYQGIKDLKGTRLACNMGISQSGWAAPQNMAIEHGFSFDDILLTGAHSASAQAVQDGRADTAALDAVTWKMIKRYEPWAGDLRVVTRTPFTPMLPYITGYEDLVPHLAVIVANAIDGLSQEDRETLCLRGLTHIPAEKYLAVPSPTFPKVTGA